MLCRRISLIRTAALFVSLTFAGGVQGDESSGGKIRIGTYDSRAIAIAFASSNFNPVDDKIKALEQAKKDGDEDKVKQLEHWGKQYQRQLHFQGFGRVPVDDLLEPVKDEIAKLAREQHLFAISMHCDFASERVELIDITDGLVKLYSPSEKTLQHIRGIRSTKPISLTQLATAAVDE